MELLLSEIGEGTFNDQETAQLLGFIAKEWRGQPGFISRIVSQLEPLLASPIVLIESSVKFLTEDTIKDMTFMIDTCRKAIQKDTKAIRPAMETLCGIATLLANNTTNQPAPSTASVAFLDLQGDFMTNAADKGAIEKDRALRAARIAANSSPSTGALARRSDSLRAIEDIFALSIETIPIVEHEEMAFVIRTLASSLTISSIEEGINILNRHTRSFLPREMEIILPTLLTLLKSNSKLLDGALTAIARLPLLSLLDIHILASLFNSADTDSQDRAWTEMKAAISKKSLNSQLLRQFVLLVAQYSPQMEDHCPSSVLFTMFHHFMHSENNTITDIGSDFGACLFHHFERLRYEILSTLLITSSKLFTVPQTFTEVTTAATVVTTKKPSSSSSKKLAAGTPPSVMNPEVERSIDTNIPTSMEFFYGRWRTSLRTILEISTVSPALVLPHYDLIEEHFLLKRQSGLYSSIDVLDHAMRTYLMSYLHSLAASLLNVALLRHDGLASLLDISKSSMQSANGIAQASGLILAHHLILRRPTKHSNILLSHMLQSVSNMSPPVRTIFYEVICDVSDYFDEDQCLNCLDMISDAVIYSGAVSEQRKPEFEDDPTLSSITSYHLNKAVFSEEGPIQAWDAWTFGKFLFCPSAEQRQAIPNVSLLPNTQQLIRCFLFLSRRLDPDLYERLLGCKIFDQAPATEVISSTVPKDFNNPAELWSKTKLLMNGPEWNMTAELRQDLGDALRTLKAKRVILESILQTLSDVPQKNRLESFVGSLSMPPYVPVFTDGPGSSVSAKGDRSHLNDLLLKRSFELMDCQRLIDKIATLLATDVSLVLDTRTPPLKVNHVLPLSSSLALIALLASKQIISDEKSTKHRSIRLLQQSIDSLLFWIAYLLPFPAHSSSISRISNIWHVGEVAPKASAVLSYYVRLPLSSAGSSNAFSYSIVSIMPSGSLSSPAPQEDDTKFVAKLLSRQDCSGNGSNVLFDALVSKARVSVLPYLFSVLSSDQAHTELKRSSLGVISMLASFAFQSDIKMPTFANSNGIDALRDPTEKRIVAGPNLPFSEFLSSLSPMLGPELPTGSLLLQFGKAISNILDSTEDCEIAIYAASVLLQLPIAIKVRRIVAMLYSKQYCDPKGIPREILAHHWNNSFGTRCSLKVFKIAPLVNVLFQIATQSVNSFLYDSTTIKINPFYRAISDALLKLGPPASAQAPLLPVELRPPVIAHIVSSNTAIQWCQLLLNSSIELLGEINDKIKHKRLIFWDVHENPNVGLMAIEQMLVISSTAAIVFTHQITNVVVDDIEPTSTLWRGKMKHMVDIFRTIPMVVLEWRRHQLSLLDEKKTDSSHSNATGDGTLNENSMDLDAPQGNYESSNEYFGREDSSMTSAVPETTDLRITRLTPIFSIAKMTAGELKDLATSLKTKSKHPEIAKRTKRKPFHAVITELTPAIHALLQTAKQSHIAIEDMKRKKPDNATKTTRTTKKTATVEPEEPKLTDEEVRRLVHEVMDGGAKHSDQFPPSQLPDHMKETVNVVVPRKKAKPTASAPVNAQTLNEKETSSPIRSENTMDI